MSRKKTVAKEAGDTVEAKKHAPRKWASLKKPTTAEILWRKVVEDDGKDYMNDGKLPDEEKTAH